MAKTWTEADNFKYHIKMVKKSKSRAALRQYIYGQISQGWAFMELERAKAIKEWAGEEADRMMKQYASLIPDDWKE